MNLALTQADGLAISMIVILVVAFGVVLTILVSISRNAARQNREVEHLLEEVEAEFERPERAPASEGEEEPAEPWSRHSDWWKSEDS